MHSQEARASGLYYSRYCLLNLDNNHLYYSVSLDCSLDYTLHYGLSVGLSFYRAKSIPARDSLHVEAAMRPQEARAPGLYYCHLYYSVSLDCSLCYSISTGLVFLQD